MSIQILSGPAAAKALLDETKIQVAELENKAGITPHLAIVRVGEDPASVSYVRGKDKKAAETGLKSSVHIYPESITQQSLLEVIHALNIDKSVHGILVQLPLPKHINEQAILLGIDPKKDVDGFHPMNAGLLWSGSPLLAPCTPLGIMYLLRHYGIEVAGKRVVIVGRSNIVGRPLAGLMLNAHGTVTVAHSRSLDLPKLTLEADIIVAAVGKPHFITKDMVKRGAVVIDVGINRDNTQEKPRLLGDVHPDVMEVASAMTPVPGGVGPMTIAQLLSNTIQLAKTQTEKTLC